MPTAAYHTHELKALETGGQAERETHNYHQDHTKSKVNYEVKFYFFKSQPQYFSNPIPQSCLFRETKDTKLTSINLPSLMNSLDITYFLFGINYTVLHEYILLS